MHTKRCDHPNQWRELAKAPVKNTQTQTCTHRNTRIDPHTHTHTHTDTQTRTWSKVDTHFHNIHIQTHIHIHIHIHTHTHTDRRGSFMASLLQITIILVNLIVTICIMYLVLLFFKAFMASFNQTTAFVYIGIYVTEDKAFVSFHV
jgi:hypothetical protein